MKKTILSGIAALALVAGIGAAQALMLDEVKSNGYIQGATANEVPYGYMNPDGTAAGIGPEVAIAVLKKMYANVKRLPFEWDEQQAYAKTPEGMGVHALNIDGDIGPMLQAMKLRTLRDTAEQQGRGRLSGAEMELMNLAGPLTGLEMLQDPGAGAPTPNFFARRAYYVNKMVIGLTGAQLKAELDRRMSQAIKTPGSQEFADAFDAVAGGHGAER